MPQTNSSDKLLLWIAIVSILLSFIGLIVAYSSVVSHRGGLFTGFAVENTSIGTVNLTVQNVLLINFTTWNIDFGSGALVAGADQGNLTSTAQNNEGVTGFNEVDTGLILENIGNLNATLFMVFEKNASDFLGGTRPSYKFNITNVEEGSCVVNHPNFTLGEWYEVNDTAQLNISDNGIRICDVFWYSSTNDTIRIDIQLGLPSDSQTGNLGDRIIAGVCDTSSNC